jgi:alpha-ribazole phosphatase
MRVWGCRPQRVQGRALALCGRLPYPPPMNTPTGFWLLRHALVEPSARSMLYGTLDVALCEQTLQAQADAYRSLAAHLPQPAHWVVSPLCRTRQTAAAIFAAGYPDTPLLVEPDVVEQHLGAWQGLAHAEVAARLRQRAHPFWPLAADERPPEGETLEEVRVRMGAALERLAARWPGEEIVVVSHGGAIRTAIAYAMGIAAGPTLHLAIQNLSLSRIERHGGGWRVTCVNASPETGRDYAQAA